MKTYYKRNTHDEDGQVTLNLDISKTPGETGFICHMLLSDNLMTFEEVIEAYKDYAKQEAEGPVTPEEVAFGLCTLLSLGLAKAVSI